MITNAEPHEPVFEDAAPAEYPSLPEKTDADLLWRVEQYVGETPRISYGPAGTHPLPSLDVAHALSRVITSLLGGTLPTEIAEEFTVGPTDPEIV